MKLFLSFVISAISSNSFALDASSGDYLSTVDSHLYVKVERTERSDNTPCKLEWGSIVQVIGQISTGEIIAVVTEHSVTKTKNQSTERYTCVAKDVVSFDKSKFEHFANANKIVAEILDPSGEDKELLKRKEAKKKRDAEVEALLK